MAVPTVTGLDPASGPEGTQVLIIGTGFTEDVSRVRFGSYECSLNYTVISDTAISAIVPAGSGTQTCYVTNPDGTNGTGSSFTFATYEGGSNNAPAISGVAPNTSATTDGEGGDTVVITGNYFTTTIAVYFGPTLATAVRAAFTVDSPTQITATAPRGEPGVQAYVFVENAYGTYSSTSTVNDFYYPSASVPTVTSLTPTSGMYGSLVTITGTNFISATAVRFGTLYAQFTIVDATTIRATAPGDQSFLGSAVNVYVSNPWGESTTYQAFTYASTGTLRTTLTLSSGTPAMSPRDLWIQTTGDITATLTAVYPPWAGETNVESKWYRLDGGATTKYTGTFVINGEGSHKVEFWAVGKDGVVEPTNVRYVNIVAATTVTGLTATAGTGIIIYKWTPVKIVGVRYEVVCDTNASPSTLVATVESATYTFKVASPMTSYYCKVRAVSADGTNYTYSSIVGPTTALQTAADLADQAISNAKLAPSLRPPPLLATAPTDFTNYPSGSYYYNITNETLYVSTGSSWNVASLTTAVLGKVVSGVIEAGAIGADEIAAGSITTANLVVADFDNIVQNGNSEADPTGYDTTTASPHPEFRGVQTTNPYRGTRCRRIAGTGSSVYISPIMDLAVKTGDKFSFSAKGRCGSSGSTYGCSLYLQGVNAAKDTVTEEAATGWMNGTTYTDLGTSLKINSTSTVWMRAYMVFNGAVGNYGYFDELLLRRNLSGSLIVDGEITGTTFTGGTFRTYPSGQRIEMVEGETDRVSVYTGSSIETSPGMLQSYGYASGGYVYMKGPVVTGGDASPPSWSLWNDTANGAQASLYATSVSVGAGQPGDNVYGQTAARTKLGGAVSIGPSRQAPRRNEHEFMGAATQYDAASTPDEWYCTDLNQTMSRSIGGAADHPGILSITSNAAGASGMVMRQGWNALYLNTSSGVTDYDYCEFTFRVPSTTSARVRMGWMGTANMWGSNWPTLTWVSGDYGAIIDINGTTLKGMVIVNGTEYNTGTGYTITQNTWYTGRIKVESGSHVHFYLFSASDGSVLYNPTNIAQFPSGSVGHGFMCWKSTTGAGNIFDIDYMNYYLHPRSR